jgi:hypothetical protein
MHQDVSMKRMQQMETNIRDMNISGSTKLLALTAHMSTIMQYLTGKLTQDDLLRPEKKSVG